MDRQLSALRAGVKISAQVQIDFGIRGCARSGSYVMYISGDQKERLRRYAGVAVQIDATAVQQPINPGDGLIREFEFLGLAPEPDDSGVLNSLELVLSKRFMCGPTSSE